MANTEIEVLKEKEFNRYGLISVILLVLGCIGVITIGLGAVENVFALTLVVISTMTTVSMLLAIAPMNAIFTSAYIAIGIDILLISYYTFIQ